MSKLQGYFDDLTNKRKILTKGEFVELSPGATKEILEILVKHKEAIEQLEQSQEANQKLVKALEHYAEQSYYNFEIEYTGDIEDIWEDLEIRGNHDRGEYARQTLSEVKGNG